MTVVQVIPANHEIGMGDKTAACHVAGNYCLACGNLKESVEKNNAMELKKKDDQSAVKDMFVDFASSTTAHGISRFATAPVWTAKVSWFLIWLGVMAGFIYMVAGLIVLFNSKPVSTSVSVSYEQEITFPGVTICNLNILQLSQSQDIVDQKTTKKGNTETKDKEIEDLYKTSFDSPAGVNPHALIADEVLTDEADTYTTINSLPGKEKAVKGHQFDGFIIHCSWSGLRCDQGYFKQYYWAKSWNWKYGNCYTFNGYTNSNGSKIEPLAAGGSGVRLRMTIDIKHKEYLPILTVEKGIRVLIADQDIALLPDEEGISISPGVSASVSLRKQSIIRQDVYNNGSCKEPVTVMGQKYTMENCQKNCNKRKQTEMCNCTSVSHSQSDGSRNCFSVDQEKCLIDVKKNFTKKIYDCSNLCPVACSNVVFHQTVTLGKIHAPGYMSLYKVQDKTEQYVQDNIIQLSVYFGDNAVETVETTAYYEFGNLISDIGGQLGLWIGVSAVTCVEFIALIWNLIVYLAYQRKKPKVDSQAM